MNLEDLFTRRWVCNVANQRCKPEHPHDEVLVGCGFRHVASFADEEFAVLLKRQREEKNDG